MMSEISGLSSMGSSMTDAVLSSKEKLYFRRMFETGSTGDDLTSSMQQAAVASAQPHLGSKLNLKI